MSLSGNTYYSVQNLQNESAFADIEAEVATNTENIAINTANIATNTSDIATNTSNIATNTSNIATNTSNIATNTSNIATNTSNIATNTGLIATNTSNISTLQAEQITQNTNIANNTTVNNTQDANISSILQRITDVQYNSGADTTYIFNRLEIRAPIQSGVSSQPQLLIYNNATDPNNQISTSLLSGLESGQWNTATREGDCLFLARKSGIDSYLGGFLFTTHATAQRGMRLSMNPAIPSQFWSDLDMGTYNITTTGDITAGTITLAGLDLTTTLNTLSSSIATNTYNLTPITYVSVPGIPGGPPITEICTITSQDINIDGDVLINGHDIITEITTNTSNIATNTANIATNTANIATNTANIATNTANIYTWINDVNASSYDLNNVSALTATSVTANNLITNNLEIPSLDGYSNSFITTSNTGETTIIAEAPSGSESYVVVSTHDTSGSTTLLTIGNSTIDTGGRWITGMNNIQIGTFYSATATASGTNYTVIQPSPYLSPPVATVTSTGFTFLRDGTYQIRLAWEHSGSLGGDTDFNAMVSDSSSATVYTSTPSFANMYNNSFTGNSNGASGWASGANDRNPIQIDDSSENFRYDYTVKVNSGVPRKNRWFVDITGVFSASDFFCLKILGGTAWSTSASTYMIIQIA